MDKTKLKILLDVEITNEDACSEMQSDYNGLAYVYALCGGGGGCAGCGGGRYQ